MPLQTINCHAEMVGAIARGDGPAARQVIESYLEESALTLVLAMQKMHTQETAQR